MATNLKLSSEQLLLVKAAATPIKRKFDGKARVETWKAEEVILIPQ